MHKGWEKAQESVGSPSPCQRAFQGGKSSHLYQPGLETSSRRSAEKCLVDLAMWMLEAGARASGQSEEVETALWKNLAQKKNVEKES